MEKYSIQILFFSVRPLIAKFYEDLQVSGESPTGRLLSEWENRSKTLPEFVQAMKDIGRMDVVEAIRRVDGSAPHTSESKLKGV